MREVIFRIGMLFFCLTTIACIGMGVSLENTLVRATIIFFFFISIIYILMYIFSRSEESEMEVKTKIVDELLNDDNFEIINHRIEERAKILMDEELEAQRLKEAEEQEEQQDEEEQDEFNENIF